ncbi:precoat protein [Siegesbeckia yellow vein virus-[GD27]]|uniref:Protein V2 n=9 Tax=Siegesbeckia yellow vein virus TaxID=371401 RepID=Q14RY5_9GEMI|nr:precoat protein [Siegesbeckia yellow vein virus]CAJ76436.1 precoat protein [Siegesbeckia yellow vein virus-[GD24]]CAJ76442.1 precoat protein [Siegesbeckia yellow vein virus-[GD27]]CAJ76448.1 precoat protein [Siegesbeckia yellow vein virus-[GD11]]CAJ76450.1 precoat protein [Siegesbeckia yellow vein virus-[GD12]]CAJ76454.1 precoat protein [Siegesbeckia yellow vein virus-[GD21]]CAJ76456.1 precoat protein [Siegesbeckia yellow vein virus-[GD22]]CAJ76458.1 precoat protein [Siegesbeckia yellow v
MKMWDPLINEFPETVHGFRCMLAIKYLQAVQLTYSPDTVGYDLIRELIRILRTKDYGQATCRYSHFHSRLQGTSEVELRQPLSQQCCCPNCPCHQQKEDMGQSAHVQKAQNVQDVQKP